MNTQFVEIKDSVLLSYGDLKPMKHYKVYQENGDYTGYIVLTRHCIETTVDNIVGIVLHNESDKGEHKLLFDRQKAIAGNFKFKLVEHGKVVHTW